MTYSKLKDIDCRTICHNTETLEIQLSRYADRATNSTVVFLFLICTNLSYVIHLETGEWILEHCLSGRGYTQTYSEPYQNQKVL